MGMIYTEIEQYKIWLKNNLTEERYLHSLGTAEVAKELALRFNLDVKKAELAGLIHDCAKCLDKDALLDLMKNCKTLSEEELNNIKTYHAPAGEVLAQKEFGIVDEEILSAIRWHTIGKIGMSDFDKIIFILTYLLNRFFGNFFLYRQSHIKTKIGAVYCSTIALAAVVSLFAMT